MFKKLSSYVSEADTTTPSQQELDLLFGPLYDEFFTEGTSSVNKSSSPSDNSTQQDTPPITNIQSSTKPTTPTANVNAEENNTDNQAEIQVDNAHVDDNEFYNIFSTPVCEEAESSSRYVDLLNMHTFYQPHESEHRWTKDHPLSQVHGNPSKPVQTSRQLATDPEMCMFAAHVGTVTEKTLRRAMADLPDRGNAGAASSFGQTNKSGETRLTNPLARMHDCQLRDMLMMRGIDLEESFAPVARLKLFGFCKPMMHEVFSNFISMDCWKRTFLTGPLMKEVLCGLNQKGFVDPESSSEKFYV
ncbi:hypothetical protein Tco_0845494 [Tanacetum coccineum]